MQGDKDEVLEQNSSTSKFDLSLVTDRLLKVCFVAAEQEKGNKGGGIEVMAMSWVEDVEPRPG